ncbi:MAG: HD domain-containing protein [Sphaerochaetaceae bacterium]
MLERSNLILENEKFKKAYSIIIEAEEKRIFCKHDIEHLLSVARIMVIKNRDSAEEPIDEDIIYATALLHDIGRAKQYENGEDHNVSGGALASIILQESGFAERDIDLMSDAIKNHNNPNADGNLSKLLQFADHKSRNCYLCPARDQCNWTENRKNKGIEI